MRLIRSRLTWYNYLLSGFFNFIIAIQGNLIPSLRDELGLSYRTVSLHPSALAAGMILSGFITVRVVALLGRRRALLICTGGAVLGLLAICAARNAATSIGACALIGVTGAMLPGILGGLLAEEAGAARDQAFVEAGAITYVCAIAANLATGAAVALTLGWRAAVLFGAAGGVALMLVYGRDRVPDPPRISSRAAERLPAASIAFLIMLGLGVALEMSLLLWSPAFLEQVVGLSRPAAVTAAAAFAAAMLLGRWAGSFVVRRVPPALLYPANLCLIVPGFALYWAVGAPVAAVAGLFVCGLAVALLYPLSLSFAVGAAGAAGSTASARSGLFAGSAILLAPFALGTLADNFGLARAYLIAPFLAGAILLCFAIARTLQRRGAYAASAWLS